MMDKLLCHKNRQSSTDDQSIVGWRSFVIPITIEIIIFICPLLVRFVRYMSPTGDLDGPGFHHCRANELTITCRCASTNIYVLIWFLCSMNNEEGLLLSYHLASTKLHSHCSPKFIHLWLLSSSPSTCKSILTASVGTDSCPRRMYQVQCTNNNCWAFIWWSCRYTHRENDFPLVLSFLDRVIKYGPSTKCSWFWVNCTALFICHNKEPLARCNKNLATRLQRDKEGELRMQRSIHVN